jgi:hypothetical protein
MKAKLLSFPFFYFHFLFGIDTFQGVTAKKIKKLSAAELASRVAPKTPTLASLFLCSRVIGLKPLSFDQQKVYDKLSFLPSFFDELLTGGGAG